MEPLLDNWEYLKKYLRMCPHNGMQLGMQVQIFDNGYSSEVKSSLDATSGGAFMLKEENDTWNLIEDMALNCSQ